MRSSIRKSTNADLEAIDNWVREEDLKQIPGNFLCNWNLTEKCHNEGRLLVYFYAKSQIPVAYQWGGLLNSGILQVKYEMRGKGIGSKLVSRRILEAYKKDECILYIQCKPSASIPFWEKMGFTIYNKDYNNYAYRILEKKLPLPIGGKIVNTVIRFYPEDFKWSKALIAPIKCLRLEASKLIDNNIYLSERVSFFEDIYRQNTGRDVVVEIEVDSKIIYCDKAKYSEAQTLGVKSCLNGFYIDKIQLQPKT